MRERAAELIGRLTPERRRQIEERERVRAEEAASVVELVKLPGWEVVTRHLFEQRALVQRQLLSLYPVPTNENPTGELRSARIEWYLGQLNILDWMIELAANIVGAVPGGADQNSGDGG